jgi:dihydrofolate reductase
MGRIVATEFMSLDGVVEDPGGSEGSPHGGWTFRFDRGAEGDRFKLSELKEADAQLLGRVTYAAFAEAWPARQDPMGFAARMNTMPKYVASTTLRDEDATWENTTVVRGDVVAELAALKERVEGDLLVAGSVTLVRTLLERRLLDELRLMVFPIVLGTGRRLFGDVTEPPTLVLGDVATVGDGIVILTYRSPGAGESRPAASRPSAAARR